MEDTVTDLVTFDSIDSAIRHVIKISRKLSYELGFVSNISIIDAIKHHDLICVPYGFCLFHTRRDNQITIHYIDVHPEYSGQGIGQRLLNILKIIAKHRQKNLLLAKCPIDLPSNKFYLKNKFILSDIQEGRKRRLNIWKYYIT